MDDIGSSWKGTGFALFRSVMSDLPLSAHVHVHLGTRGSLWGQQRLSSLHLTVLRWTVRLRK